MKATPTERIAGLAFFAFVVMQVPFLVVESDLAASGIVLLSPLQVTAATLAKQFPGLFHYFDDTLVPGGWVRESLSPYIKCHFKSNGKGTCTQEKARLWDVQYVRKGTNLALLVELLESNTLEQQTAIVYGSTMIVVSAVFSLYYSVKTAILGFVLLFYGAIKGGHIPLPPSVLMAFLCLYSGFQLGEVRGKARAAAQQRKGAAGSGQQPPGATVQKMPGAAAGQATPGKSIPSKQKKQRKQA